MELKIFKDKEIKIDFDDVKTETSFKSEITESNFVKMIEKYRGKISYLGIEEENFSKEMLAAVFLTKDFYYAAKNNEISIRRDNENTTIDYLGRTVLFASQEVIDRGYIGSDMFHEFDSEILIPLKAEDYEKYRKMFKIVDILIPEHYGAKYGISEIGKTVKLEKYFNTGGVWEILMNGSAVASGVKGYIDNLKIDEDKKTEHFSEEFIPKEFKDKKLRADNVFMLEGNKGNLNFKNDENLIEVNYGDVIFDINTKIDELIFSNEKEEAIKYFLSLIENAKEYVRAEDFEVAERILRKTIRTEYSEMLEKLKDVSF
jgi:hypothetical protein